MPKVESEEIKRVHINLYASDLEWLESVFGGTGNMGISKAVRIMVRNSRKTMLERATAQHRAVPALTEEELGL